MHVAWPSCAWLLLNFSPFPVGQTIYAHCRLLVRLEFSCCCDSRTSKRKMFAAILLLLALAAVFREYFTARRPRGYPPRRRDLGFRPPLPRTVPHVLWRSRRVLRKSQEKVIRDAKGAVWIRRIAIHATKNLRQPRDHAT